jgi:hypothetical protein
MIHHGIAGGSPPSTATFPSMDTGSQKRPDYPVSQIFGASLVPILSSHLCPWALRPRTFRLMTFCPGSLVPERFVPGGFVPGRFVPELFFPERFVPGHFFTRSFVQLHFVLRTFRPRAFRPRKILS